MSDIIRRYVSQHPHHEEQLRRTPRPWWKRVLSALASKGGLDAES